VTSLSEDAKNATPEKKDGRALSLGEPVYGARLAPVLGRWTAMAIVMGAVIGSGIFIKPRVIAESLPGNLGLILSLWLMCGLVNLCGALTMAELAAMMPHAGGTYVYLREAYGRWWAFLWGWAELWVIRSGSIAAIACGMVISVQILLGSAGWSRLDKTGEAITACLFIALLGWINVIGTRWGGWVQNVTTIIKVASVGFLALLPVWVLFRGVPVPAATGPDLAPLSLSLTSWVMWAGIGSSLSAMMWVFDGWGNISTVAEEIREPQVNIPWALVGGVGLLTVLFVGANLGYHLILSWRDLAEAPVPAGAVLERLWPSVGNTLVAGMLLISVGGALNSNVLMGPRVLFAMARDGVFLRPFGQVHPRYGTPAVAIIGLCVWSMILIGLATCAPALEAWLIQVGLLPGPFLPPDKPLFDVLTDYCIFGGSVFYLTSTMAVFVLRWRYPDAPRPYRTFAYPVVPAIFVIAYVFLLALLFLSNMAECLGGLAFIALGLPVYWLFAQEQDQRRSANRPD